MRSPLPLMAVLATMAAPLSSLAAVLDQEAPSNLVAAAVSSRQIDLSWQDNSRHETGFLIERARDVYGVPGAWARLAVVGANLTVFSDRTVVPNRTYWYRVCEFGHFQQRSRFSNLARATTLPGSPVHLTATATSASEIDLAWRGDAYGETGFKLERAPDNGGVPGAWTQIAALPASTSRYADTGLSSSAAYWFRVRAYNEGGDSVDTTPVSAHTSCKLSVIGWGNDSSGQTETPADLDNVIAVSAGSSHSLALKSDGKVVGWGENSYGQATPPTNLAGVMAISAGAIHSLALKSNGIVVGWGDNEFGEAAPPTNLTGVIAIAAGGSHSLALRNDGTVIGWGEDGAGQSTPPTNLTGVVAIAAGRSHSLALKSDGTIVFWGNDYYGVDVPPTNLTGVIAIAAGSDHSLALRHDGTVVAWGQNFWGQSTPPTNLSGVVAIAAGSVQDLALKSDGTVVGWGGYDFYGQLSPGGLTGVTAISAGDTHNLALSTTPAVPMGGKAEIVASDQIHLSWTASSTATGGYTIERAPNTNFFGPGDWLQVGAVGPNTNRFDDTGVATNTTYWYRIQAHNSNCGDSIFSYPIAMTVSIPSAPYYLSAVLGTTNHVDLGWYETFGGVDGFRIERAPDTNGNPGSWVEIATIPATNSFDSQGYIQHTVSFSDMVGSANATYWYRVRAFNALGNSDYGSPIKITIRSPYAPSLWGSPFANTAQLSWYDYDYDEAVSNLTLERALDAGGQPGTWSQILATNSVFSGSYIDAGLSVNTTYWYRARVSNWVGDSDYSQSFAVTILPPGAPGGLTANIGYSNQVDLTWSESMGDQNGFKLERAPDAGGVPGSWTEIATLNISNVNYVSCQDSNVTPNAVWWYRVRAFNVLGYSDYSEAASVNLVPPAAPDFLEVFSFRDQVNLYWYDYSGGALGYQLERAPDVGGSPGAWSEIQEFSPAYINYVYWTDINLTANATYWYRVRAFNWIGESDYTGPTSATIVPPASPAYMSASIGVSNQVDLTWYDSVGDQDGFTIERAPDVGGAPGSWTAIAAVPLVGSYYYNYSDTNVTANTTYWYRVSAYNSIGQSDYTDPASIALVPPGAPYLTGDAFRDQAQLNWTDYSGGVMGFKVERAADAGGAPGTWAEIAEIDPAQNGNGSYIDTGLTGNVTYWYRVRAFNWTGDSPYSSPMSITILPPGTPFTPSTFIGTTNQVIVSWQDGYGDADGFLLESAPDAGGVPGSWTELTTVYVTNAYFISYTNTNAVAYTTNWFRVRAFNPAGISDYTGPVSVRTVPPPAPFSLSASPFRDQAYMSWYADYSSYGYVDHFEIERAPDAGGSPGAWMEIGTVVNVGPYYGSYYYTDTARPPGSTWWYRVRASNWIGESDYAPAVSVTIVPPGAPSNVSAVIGTTTNQVNVSWYDSYNDEDGFVVGRAPDVAGSPGLWTDIATNYATNNFNTVYTDSNVVAYATNWYRVRAFSLTGISSNSAPASVATLPPTAPLILYVSPFANQAQLSWSDFSTLAEGVTSFKVDRASDVAGLPGTWALVATITNINYYNYYSDPGLAPNTKYWYRVRASNWIGESSNSPMASVTIVPPAPPYSLSAQMFMSNRVDLNWSMNSPYDEDGFKLERAQDAGGAPGSWMEIATIYATNASYANYADTNLILNTTFWYRVRSFNAVGFSTYSSSVSFSLFPAPAPTSLTGTVVSTNQVYLSWYPGDPGSTVGYKVERAPDLAGAPGAWTQITNIVAPTFSMFPYVDCIDHNVAASSTYWYRVRAYNWVGDSPYAGPLVIHVGPPAAPTLSMPVLNNGQFILQVNGVAGQDYAIQTSSNLVNWSTVFTTNLAPAVFQWIDTNAPVLPSLFYRVQAGSPLP